MSAFNTLFDKNKTPNPQTVGRFHLFASILILGLFILVMASVFWKILPPHKDLYNELWGPASLLVNGKSPYDTSSLNPELPAAWLPMSIGFFAPIGWLGEETAMGFWLVLNLVELGAIVFIAQQKYNPAHLTILTAVLAFTFPPAIHHLLLGQFALTATLCVVLAIPMLVQGRHWSGAFLLALGLSKPHLLTVTMLGLSLWYFQHGGIPSILKFWGRVALAALVLCMPLFIGYPNWIPDALKSMASNPPWTYPTLYVTFKGYLGNIGYLPWALIVIAILYSAFLLWKRFEPPVAAYWSLGLALLITPYLGSWDFVSLLPLIVYTFIRSDKLWKGILLFLFILAWGGMAYLQIQEDFQNYFFWWVPVYLLGVVALVNWRSPSKG